MPYPGYMPDEQDNLHIWERVFADWMKTDDYAEQPPQNQEIARQVWDGIQALKDAAAQRDAMLQTATAMQMGMQNATKPTQPKPLPSAAGPRGIVMAADNDIVVCIELRDRRDRRARAHPAWAM
jgi:hypothetical protein